MMHEIGKGLDYRLAVRYFDLSNPIRNSDGSVTIIGIAKTTCKFILMFDRLEAELYMPHKSTVYIRVRDEEIARYVYGANMKDDKWLYDNDVNGLPLEWVFLEYVSQSYARICLDKKNDIWKSIDIQGFIISSYWEMSRFAPKNKVFALYSSENEVFTSSKYLTIHEYEKFDKYCKIQAYHERWPNFPLDPVDRKSQLQFARIAVLK